MMKKRNDNVKAIMMKCIMIMCIEEIIIDIEIEEEKNCVQ